MAGCQSRRAPKDAGSPIRSSRTCRAPVPTLDSTHTRPRPRVRQAGRFRRRAGRGLPRRSLPIDDSANQEEAQLVRMLVLNLGRKLPYSARRTRSISVNLVRRKLRLETTGRHRPKTVRADGEVSVRQAIHSRRRDSLTIRHRVGRLRPVQANRNSLGSPAITPGNGHRLPATARRVQPRRRRKAPLARLRQQAAAVTPPTTAAARASGRYYNFFPRPGPFQRGPGHFFVWMGEWFSR